MTSLTVDGTPDRTWVDEFLSTQTVPVRIATRTPSGGLWMLSLWYGYDADAETLGLATGADARVVDYLEHDPGVAFEVSTNHPPYRGVRGQGTASIEPDDEKALLRALLDRYLGGTDNDLGNWLLRDEREEVQITIEIDAAYAWDYSERMHDVVD